MEINLKKQVPYLFLWCFLYPFQSSAQNKSKATPSACSTANAEKRIHMTSLKFWKIVQNQPETLYFMDMDKCFVLNQKVEVVETKNSDDIVYWRAIRGTAKIKKVEKINFSEYKKREAKQTIERELNHFRDKLAGFTGKKSTELDAAPLIAVTVVADKLTDSLKTYGSPRIHPEATTLKKINFADEVKNKRAYDVRPANLRKKVPLKNAKSLEFSDYSQVSSEILSPEEMRKRKIKLNTSFLPKDKNEPVNLISGCPGEYSAYNAVTLLASMGYKKIGWFPGGMSEYVKKPQPCLTPANSPAATVVNAGQVLSLLQDKKKNVILDVRNERRFFLPGAKIKPFRQQQNTLKMPTYRHNVNAAGLISHKEGYKGKINIPADKMILVVGENEYDWRAYKATIFLQSKGYKNIYWYRLGMNDWAQKVLFSPKQYKLNRTVKSGELY